jgi:hypothetical protein
VSGGPCTDRARRSDTTRSRRFAVCDDVGGWRGSAAPRGRWRDGRGRGPPWPCGDGDRAAVRLCGASRLGVPTGSATRCGRGPCRCTRETPPVRTTRAPRAPAGPGVPPGRPVHSGAAPHRLHDGGAGQPGRGRSRVGAGTEAGGRRRGGAAHSRGRPVPGGPPQRALPAHVWLWRAGLGNPVTRAGGCVDRRQRCDGGPRAGDRGAGCSRRGGPGRSAVRTRSARPRAAGGASG